MPAVARTYTWYGRAMTSSKTELGSFAVKNAAAVNIIGAVSPAALPMPRIDPVSIPGKAFGKTIL